MTRTPDEIKKGLEFASIDCRDAFDCEKNCAYYKECSTPDYETACVPCTMLFDALDLIQQLQADNAQQARCIENLTDKLNAAHAETVKLQAERDALVADLRRAMHCPSCANWKKPEKAAVCFACQYGRSRRFEWRGVQKEE